jgi:hypothetical protein
MNHLLVFDNSISTGKSERAGLNARSTAENPFLATKAPRHKKKTGKIEVL